MDSIVITLFDLMLIHDSEVSAHLMSSKHAWSVCRPSVGLYIQCIVTIQT